MINLPVFYDFVRREIIKMVLLNTFSLNAPNLNICIVFSCFSKTFCILTLKDT